MLLKLLLLGIAVAALHAAPQRRTPADCMRNSKVPGHNIRLEDEYGSYLAGRYNNKTRFQCINQCMANEDCMSIDYKESQKICHLNNEVILEEDIGQHSGWQYCSRRNVAARQFNHTTAAPATTPKYESEEESHEESEEGSGEGLEDEMYVRLLAKIFNHSARQFNATTAAPATTPRYESDEESNEQSEEQSGEVSEDEFSRRLLTLLDARRNRDPVGAECIEDSKVPGNNILLGYEGDAGGYENETRYQCVTKCMNTETCMSIDYRNDICHLNTKVIDEEDIGQHEGWSYCPRRPE